MIPLFFSMGAQVQAPISLSACFLEEWVFPFEILDLVGQFFYNCDQLLVGGGELSAVCKQFLHKWFLVDCGGVEVVKVSFKVLHAPLVDAFVCFHLACGVNPCGRTFRAKLVITFSGLRFYSRFGVRSLVRCLPFGPYYIGLRSILQVVIRPWKSFRC